MERIDVTVRSTSGTYAASHKGTRVTCTTGPQQAAQRLAAKLWGEGHHVVQRANKPDTTNHYSFELIKEPQRCPRTRELPLE